MSMCGICLALVTDHAKRRMHRTIVQCEQIVNRYAFNIDGTVGLLYDGSIDEIIYGDKFEKNFIIDEPINKTPNCTVVSGDQLIDGELLEILDLQRDLWLSVMLNITSTNELINKLKNYEISNDCHTYFLHYRWMRRNKRLIDNADIDILKKIFFKILDNNKATHIITKVTEGIEFIIAVQLPKNEQSDVIKIILEKICKYFTEETTDFLTIDEQQIINQTTSILFTPMVEVQSRTNSKNFTFTEISEIIHDYLFLEKQNISLQYTLHPIKISHADDELAGRTVRLIDENSFRKIRKIIINLFNKLKILERWFTDNQSVSNSDYFKLRYDRLYEQMRIKKGTYEDIRNKLSNFVMAYRMEGMNECSLDSVLENLHHDRLDTELENVFEETKALKNKVEIIDELRTKYGIDYVNVKTLEDDICEGDSLEQKLLSKYGQESVHILCSTDRLIRDNPIQYKEFCEQLVDEKKRHPTLQIIYGDYSECKTIPLSMRLLPETFHISTSSITQPKEINILLLGETGVGKSTFINAFVNYLAFDSIKQAEQKEPIVIIPVSFTVSAEDEYQVKLGEHDRSKEDFNHPGQTITQHCQSYVFSRPNQIRLRLIDTPGIGDGRGISQDDQNIQNILSYVTHLGHLNAVCILLKPNITRIHILFRSCLEQIFNFLGPQARDNILFCFTSSRSTFFSSGSTTPILKKMLNDMPADYTLQLSKANLFFFDNETFRYLAAIGSKQNIQFDDLQKVAYETSWNKSLEETNRLINRIETHREHQMNIWHSIKHAQISILLLARPILETLRLILRNEILKTIKNNHEFLSFEAQTVQESSYVCTECSFKPSDNIHFPMVDYSIHHCQCSSDKHLCIFYRLTYKTFSTNNDNQDMRSCLLDGLVLFREFLFDIVKINDDPFLLWFDLFLAEEQFLQQKKLSNNLNDELNKQLLHLKHDYKNKQQKGNLEQIYQTIENIQHFELIRIQIKATKESQLQNHEHHI